MFKNREVTVKIAKKANEEKVDGNIIVDKPLESTVRNVVAVLEGPAKKIFAAVCIYVVLDTVRQVQIAKANNPVSESY